MSSSWNRMKGILGAVIPTSIAVLAISSGTAQAAYTVEGSDTLTEVIRNAITASGANLYYNNVGSGQAETNMRNVGNYLQSIGPMSRNFVSSVLTGATTSNWAPTDVNVLALDAGIIGVANISGRCQNVSLPLQNSADPTIAQITTDMSIILSGYPKNGPGTKSLATTAECAHPERLAALARLTSCQGVNRIDHIYRRDDKSGTQDTFREHLQMDRWCNGKSEGNTNLPGSNLKNKDLDPIRRPCIPGGPTTAVSTCTYYPTTSQCVYGDPAISFGNAKYTSTVDYGPIKCTQGLVVALSENDPGAKDITMSIANRIAADLNGFTMGLGGKALVDLPGAPNVGTNVNTVTYEDGNIRAGQYMFARRLFLQRNPTFLSAPWNGDPARKTAEDVLWTYATNRCAMRQIILDAGFLPPLATCSDPCTDPLNITCLTAEAGVGTPKMNIGAERDLCDGSHPCVADGATCPTAAGAYCAPIPAQATNYSCNVGPKCTNGTCNLDGTLLTGTCN